MMQTGQHITLAGTPVLTADRLVLRAPQASDWPEFRKFFLSQRSEFVRSTDIDSDRAWRVFASIIGHWVLRGWGSFVFTLKGDDTPIGSCGPWFPEGWPEREIGWMIWDEAYLGEGYAQEAAEAAIRFAYEELGWDSAVSYVDTRNLPSIRLAERLGAVPDPDATGPQTDDGETLVIYRHPKRTAG